MTGNSFYRPQVIEACKIVLKLIEDERIERRQSIYNKYKTYKTGMPWNRITRTRSDDDAKAVATDLDCYHKLERIDRKYGKQRIEITKILQVAKVIETNHVNLTIDEFDWIAKYWESARKILNLV